MRHLGTTIIALATLASLAGEARSQTPTMAAPRKTAAAPARRAGQARPNLATPTAEGVWVSDEQPIDAVPMPDGTYANPEEVPAQSMPGQMNGGQTYGGAEYGGHEYGGEMDGGMHGPIHEGHYDHDAMYQGHAPHGHGHLGGHTDLWTEVHSHKRVWARAQYLSLWSDGNDLPPLVTTSPIGTPQDQAGVLPESATTEILFGNNEVDKDMRNGGRIDVGYWLVDGEFYGIEGHYWGMNEISADFSASSIFSDGIQTGDQILARPFINVNPNLPQTPVEDAAIIAFPDFSISIDDNGTPDDPSDDTFTTVQLDGRIDIRATSDVMSSGALYRHLVWIDFTKCCRLDFIGGYRFFRYRDNVTINDRSDTVGGLLAPTTFESTDEFDADNQFHAGEVGFVYQCYHGPWSLEVLGKCALGNNRQVVTIDGENSVTVLGATVTTAGGLLAQPTNIGRYKRDEFAVLPELNATLRLDLTCHLRATAGYTLMYLDNMQRSGDAIDRTLNPTQIGGTLVGPARPAFAFTDNDLFLHGFNVGLEYRW